MPERPFTVLLTALDVEVRNLCGAGLTWKDADLELRAAQPAALVQHLHPHCLAAKAQRGGQRACLAHCRLDAAFWRVRDAGPVVRRCHAGLGTVHAPVADADGFLGTVCLSPVAEHQLPAAQAAVRLVARTIALAAPLRRIELAAAGPGLHPAVAAVLARLAGSACADLRAAALARTLGLSSSRLVHLLQEQTGRSFTALRDEAVMRRARTLLGEGLAVGDVAARLGFAGPTGFASAFRRHHGVPPSRWRAEPVDQA